MIPIFSSSLCSDCKSREGYEPLNNELVGARLPEELKNEADWNVQSIKKSWKKSSSNIMSDS